MLLIRLAAEDQRIIKGANTEQELRGVKQLLLDKIQQSEILKAFNKQPTLKNKPAYPWQQAWTTAKAVLGANVTMPPYPDNSWYARINGVLKREGIDGDEVRKMAEYARDNLRMPVSFDFMICQRHRIATGEFNIKKPGLAVVATEPLLPED